MIECTSEENIDSSTPNKGNTIQIYLKLLYFFRWLLSMLIFGWPHCFSHLSPGYYNIWGQQTIWPGCNNIFLVNIYTRSRRINVWQLSKNCAAIWPGGWCETSCCSVTEFLARRSSTWRWILTHISYYSPSPFQTPRILISYHLSICIALFTRVDPATYCQHILRLLEIFWIID